MTGDAPRSSLLFNASLALVSGAIIAYEIAVMRVFSIGGWSHFGSMVISIAMFGFGVFSVVLCLRSAAFERAWPRWAGASLLALGPLMAAANTLAQRLPFNPIFLVSDPKQKYFLLGQFLLYFLPFFAGAMFIGLMFTRGSRSFGKIYFANMLGSGLGGLVLLLSMYLVVPSRLLFVPLALWFPGALAWAVSCRQTSTAPAFVLSASLSCSILFLFPQIAVSPFKGISYAEKLPDARKVFQAASPHGLMEVYSSSYFHFAPGLSDVAALTGEQMPQNAYLGMFLDGDGPIGIMKDLPQEQTGYFNYLPMSMPYLLKEQPDVFVMQLGGGISARVALRKGARHVTAAEPNPLVRRAMAEDPFITEFTGRLFANPRLTVIAAGGRTFLSGRKAAFDVIDLSLADSTGLSSPGGSSIYEKYLYTREAFRVSMEALRPGGILAVTVWNKEDPPKSTLKLMATMIQAARALSADVSREFFIAHAYLSTMTVLYKNGGFTEAETERLRKYCGTMSFDAVWYPGRRVDGRELGSVFDAYRSVYFTPGGQEGGNSGPDLTVGHLYTLVADRLIRGDSRTVLEGYVFSSAPLTDDRPYFAGFIKPADIPRFFSRLESVSDEWGYLLLWSTLGQAFLLGLLLLVLPLGFGWRTLFAPHRGKAAIIVFFSCLGIGYMLVEISLIGRFLMVLENPTVSASVLITGMLVFSGLGSLVSGRTIERSRRAMAAAGFATAAGLILITLFTGPFLRVVGQLPYPARVAACLMLLFPLAFAMGFPFALGMATLARTSRESFFVWAWGINGSFSTVGSVLVPILSVTLGLSWVTLIAACLYLLAVPSFALFAAAE